MRERVGWSCWRFSDLPERLEAAGEALAGWSTPDSYHRQRSMRRGLAIENRPLASAVYGKGAEKAGEYIPGERK
jgi:hypothetical protein